MKTNLSRTIATKGDAWEYLEELHANGESYDVTGSARDLTNLHTGRESFTTEEAARLDELSNAVDATGIDGAAYLLWLMFRDEHSIDEFERETGFVVEEADEAQASQDLGYGDTMKDSTEIYEGRLNRLLVISRDDDSLFVAYLEDGTFSIYYDRAEYNAPTLAALNEDITEGFIYAYGEDKRALTPERNALEVIADELTTAIEAIYKTHGGSDISPADQVAQDAMVGKLSRHMVAVIEKQTN